MNNLQEIRKNYQCDQNISQMIDDAEAKLLQSMTLDQNQNNQLPTKPPLNKAKVTDLAGSVMFQVNH